MKTKLKVKLLVSCMLCPLIIFIWIGFYTQIDSLVQSERTSEILDCSCGGIAHPQTQNVSESEYKIRINSTCSHKNTHYHYNQNVVSFSLYLPTGSGVASMYIKGIHMNLQRIRKYLKGFVMRVYTDVPLNDTFCKIICSNSDFSWCNIKNTPSHGDLSEMYFMTWRFIPLGDPTVDTFLVRDLDSVISQREAATMKDWLETNKTFHAMRDRKEAHFVSILGGLWGGRNSLLDNAPQLQSTLIEKSRATSKQKGSDQVVLDKFLFTPFINMFVAYDSYSCGTWENRMLVKPFPMRRRDASDFTGNPVLVGYTWSYQECPVKCRPSYGQNWTYC